MYPESLLGKYLHGSDPNTRNRFEGGYVSTVFGTSLTSHQLQRARDIADQTRIESLQELRKAKPQVLEDICQQKPPFGKKILDFVKQLPNFDVTLEIVRETIKPNGVQVSCQVILLLKNSEVVTTNKNKGPRKLTASILLMTSDSVSKGILGFSDSQVAESLTAMDGVQKSQNCYYTARTEQ